MLVMRKFVVVLSVVVGSLVAAAGAQAAVPSALGVTCTVAADNVRECGSTSPRSTSPTWDGVPIDVNIAFPPDPGSGDGNYPLIIVGHGYGGSKIGFGASGSISDMRRFTSRGYAVFSMTDRGFHESCGTNQAIADAPVGACNNGFVHLMDDRFEVRDAQFFAGELADEGLVDGQRVGAIGGSYGGGLSLQLAALKDRTMMPDGSLVPWTSPVDHIPMRIAGATPDISWSDLAYSLAPNGSTLDYVADSSYTGRIGVEKASLVSGLYVSGSLNGKYCGAPPPSLCSDPQADLTAWKTRLDAGEPYDGDPTVSSIFDEVKAHHSGYYIDHSESPAPLLISNGFTDDLFPADEAIRFYNRTRSRYPDAPLSMLFGDFGHPRAANKSADSSARDSAQDAWLDHYVKGTGSAPFQGVTAFTMTCPSSSPSGGPFQASSWAGFQKGEVRLSNRSTKRIAPNGGDPSVDSTWNPITQNPCTSASASDLSGVASYRLPAAAGSGYTLMGSPTVIAKISSPTANSEIAARLLDVDPNGTETLVDRQLYRPMVGSGKQVFQLHPSGHLFAPGHVAKLELLPKDAGGLLGGYGRTANGQGEVTISNLNFRIPVMESPGEAGGQVVAPSPLSVPCGSTVSPDFASRAALKAQLGAGGARRKGKNVIVPVDSAPGPNPCRVRVELLRGDKTKKKKGRSARKQKKSGVLGRAQVTLPGGAAKDVKVRLGKRGRAKALGGAKVTVRVRALDQAGNTVQTSKVKLAGKKGKPKKR